MLTLLVFNLFLNPKKNEIPKDTLNVSFQVSKYTIPASVKILFQNYTDSSVVFDSCNDISIFKS
jgi:hypothetical protein